MIGALPPGAIRDAKYAWAAFIGGAIAFIMPSTIQQVPAELVAFIDAAGLSLFCVAGAAKAIDYKINPMMLVLIGTIAGVGGGTVPDILLARPPGILRVDVYAVAALFGAAIFVLGLKFKLPRPLAMTLGVPSCITLRMISLSQHWNLPRLMDH